jgi:uncharacterized membrane protein
MEPSDMLILLLAAHILAALFWVGGMAFAYMVLRPAAGALEAPARLTLWRDVFRRFCLGSGLRSWRCS